MTLLWFWSTVSWKLRSSLPLLQPNGPCSGRKKVLSGLPFTTLPITPFRRFESHLCRVLCLRRLHSAQLARGQGSLGGVVSHWSLQWRAIAARPARVSVYVFLRDLDLPVRAMDQRRIEVITEELPVFHGALGDRRHVGHFVPMVNTVAVLLKTELH